jgi:hypothetical protein
VFWKPVTKCCELFLVPCSKTAPKVEFSHYKCAVCILPFFVKGTELLITNFTQVKIINNSCICLEGSRRFRLPDFETVDTWNLSAIGTGRLYSFLFKRLSRFQRLSAAERFMSMENSSYTIRNRFRDLPVGSAVPPTNCTTACSSPKLWLYKNPIPTSQKAQCVSFTNTRQLTPFWKIIAFCCENLRKCSAQSVGKMHSTGCPKKIVPFLIFIS